MKILILFLLGLTAPVFAQDVDQAYAKETQFLEKQAQSLKDMQARLKRDGESRRAEGEKELQRLNAELSALSLQNLEAQEAVQRWERLLKDSANGGAQLEKSQRRMEDQFRDLREKAPLLAARAIPAGVIGIDAFRIRLEEGTDLLASLGQPTLKPHAFLDENNRMVKGEVLSLGLFGAYGVRDGNTFTLAPYDKQWLQAAEKLSGDELLLFDPSFQRAGLKTHAGWKEQAADMAPGLIMVLIMMTVICLFVALARA